jgi:endonuclease/exonuclease/phosphatase family metal-dependent hydrolase
MGPQMNATDAIENISAPLRRRRRPRGPLVGVWIGLLIALALCGCRGGTAADALVLASWNLEHLAADDGAGCRPRASADYKELARIGRSLGADVIALQEVESEEAVARVFHPDAYDIVLSGRPEGGLGRCRRRSGQTRTAQRTGFAIDRDGLASLGLRWRALPPLTRIGIEGRRWGTRILLEPIPGSFVDPPEPIELVSLHLKSGCAWGRLSGNGLRREQCRILLRQRGILEQWIDEQAAADRPFILIGDFNRQLDQPNDDFWREIDDGEVCRWQADPRLGVRCVSASSVPDPDADLTLANAGVPFAFPFNPRYPFAIDHFVLGGTRAPSIAANGYSAIAYEGDPPPSDHHPIRLRLDWPGRRR